MLNDIYLTIDEYFSSQSSMSPIYEMCRNLAPSASRRLGNMWKTLMFKAFRPLSENTFACLGKDQQYGGTTTIHDIGCNGKRIKEALSASPNLTPRHGNISTSTQCHQIVLFGSIIGEFAIRAENFCSLSFE